MTTEDDLGTLLMRATRGLRHAWAEALEPWGISPHQFRALRAIEGADRPRLGVIADGLCVSPRSATEVVDDLETRGLVRRVPDPTDRRATCVELTGEGRRVVGEAHRARHDRAGDHFAALGAGDRAELERLLRRLVEGDHRG